MLLVLKILTVIAVAVAIALSLAHTRGLPGKLQLSLTFVLLLLMPAGSTAFCLTAIAFVALLAMHAAYWLLIHPVNNFLAQQRFDETANPAAKAVSITELSPPEGDRPKIAAKHLGTRLGLDKGAKGLVDHEIFESIYNPGKLLLLATWRDAEAAGGVDASSSCGIWQAAPPPGGHHSRPQRSAAILPEVRRAHGVAAE
jgi:hypothetical protein